MILGPVSLIDCLVFLIFLTPQLLIEAGIFATLRAAIPALPYLCEYRPDGVGRGYSSCKYPSNSGGLNSDTAPDSVRQGAISYARRISIPIRPPIFYLRGHCYPLRPVCLCKHPNQCRQSIFLRQGCIAVSPMAHVEARLHQKPRLLARVFARAGGFATDAHLFTVNAADDH